MQYKFIRTLIHHYTAYSTSTLYALQHLWTSELDPGGLAVGRARHRGLFMANPQLMKVQQTSLDVRASIFKILDFA